MAGDQVRWLVLVLGYASLAAFAWGFYDSWRWPAAAYRSADRLFRWVWLTAFGAAMVLQLWNGIWREGQDNAARVLVWLASLLVLGVYLFDVRPRVRDAASG